MPVPGPDPRANVEAFLNDHYRYFLMGPMALGATMDDAHDAVQAAVADMLEKDTWSRLTRNPKAWVRKAVRHAYYDQQESSSVHSRDREPAPAVWERRVAARTSGRTGMGGAAYSARCQATQREVFELVLAELDTREIADLLGKNPATIRQNLAHARKRLRANLGEDYQVDPD